MPPETTTKQRRERPGDRLRRLRKAKGFTQVELAEAVGTSQPMIAIYEGRDAVPGPHVLLKLCEALGASPEELLGIKRAQRAKEPESADNLRLWRKLKRVETLTPAERRQVVQLIDALVERSVLKREKAS